MPDEQFMYSSWFKICGNTCVLKAYVRDDKVVRIESDHDGKEDWENGIFQIRACPRGLSMRRHMYSPDRLKTPLKRVGKRGEGKFEPISWDEALDTVAEKLRYCIDNYGNASVYSHYASGVITGPMTRRENFWRLMNCLGGFALGTSDYSSAQNQAALRYFYGRPGMMTDHMPLFREDLREPRAPENWEPTAAARQAKAIYYQCEELDGAAGHVDSDPQWSRGKRVLFKPAKEGDSLSLDFDVAEGGKYAVHVVMCMSPTAGKCDVLLNGEPLPELSAIDLYTPFHSISRWFFFGAPPVEVKTGKNTITFVSRGKNEASNGTEIGVDFIWTQP